jgi:hypothetical protein
MDLTSLPPEYWYAIGELGQSIAAPFFTKNMERKLGWPPQVIQGHEPLYTKAFPIANYDEEACHLDLVALTVRANQRYWVHGIAEIKTTLSRKKAEFPLNGMSPRYLRIAVNCKIPVYFYVVRLPEPPNQDITTEDGMMVAYLKYRDMAMVEEYDSTKFDILDDMIMIRSD